MIEIYLFTINILGILAMWYDKARARAGSRRVPERSLYSIALLGGAIGILGGMFLFRHKTKHLGFKLGVPAVLAAQLAIILYYR